MESYDEITTILLEIERAVKMNNVFISGSAYEYNGVWNEGRAEEFSRKLAKQLICENFRITSGFGLGIGSAILNGALDEIYVSKFKHMDEYLCLRPFPKNFSKEEEKKERHAKYRKDMLQDVGIVVFLFGNKLQTNDMTGENHTINSNGCREEFEIAKQDGKIIIPLGSTGYMAKEIFDEIKNDKERYSYLRPYWDVLETETDIDRLIQVVIKIAKEQRVY